MILLDYEYYITPEEYDQASANGIIRQTLESRIRITAWEKKRAIETPPNKKQMIDKKWREIAENNGICYSTFKHRVNQLDWDVERAATQPLQDRSNQAKKANEASRKYPVEYIELAKKNGIHYDTFRGRVKKGWSLERAATQPTMAKREIGLFVKEKRSARRVKNA